MLETWAEPAGADTWRLDPARAREAVERGQSTGDFAAFIQGCDSQPLPDTVQGFLKTCESDGKALRSRREAWLFECRDSDTAAMVVAQPQLDGLCFRCGGKKSAVPAAQLSKFKREVRSLGLGVC